ncbi:MAG: hypothetical protein K9M97_00040 [Akkermansiaceae bacterium]|nr:hypothetical protein [Akkermansiaceae bacterium]
MSGSLQRGPIGGELAGVATGMFVKAVALIGLVLLGNCFSRLVRMRGDGVKAEKLKTETLKKEKTGRLRLDSWKDLFYPENSLPGLDAKKNRAKIGGSFKCRRPPSSDL